MTRAVIYARVAAVDSKGSAAVARQVTACREYAARHDLDVVLEVEHHGRTGGLRDPLGSLLATMQQAEASTVIVWGLDRLLRRLGDADRLDGIDVHVASGGPCTASERRALTRLAAAMAAVESEQRAERARYTRKAANR